MNLKKEHDANAISIVASVGLSGDDLAVAMLNQSDDCIKLLNIDGRLEFMNCNGLDAMEIAQPDMVLGKFWWELWPKQSRTFVERKFLEAARGEESSFEADCPTAMGTHRRWSVNLRPICARTGLVVSVLCISRDITV